MAQMPLPLRAIVEFFHIWVGGDVANNRVSGGDMEGDRRDGDCNRGSGCPILAFGGRASTRTVGRIYRSLGVFRYSSRLCILSKLLIMQLLEDTSGKPGMWMGLGAVMMRLDDDLVVTAAEVSQGDAYTDRAWR